MYVTIYGNIYRETLWEVNMEYMPLADVPVCKFTSLGKSFFISRILNCALQCSGD